MNRVADDPLDWMAAAVDAWRHRLDDETRRRYSLLCRNESFARADDGAAMAFENAQLSGPQRQHVVRHEIGPGAQRVFERQEFADLARNGRGRQGKIAIHSRIGKDDPDSVLVARAPDCRQNFACAGRPERDRGKRLEQVILARDERVRGSDVLAEVERMFCRKLEPAFCGADRMGEAVVEAVFEAHRNENSVAQRG